MFVLDIFVVWCLVMCVFAFSTHSVFGRVLKDVLTKYALASCTYYCLQLKKHFPNIAWKLPSKRIFGNNFDPEFIRQRRDGLNEFINTIVSHLEVLQL